MCDIAVGMTWDINNFVNISHCCLLSTVCMLVSTATGTISSSPPLPQPPYEIAMRVDGIEADERQRSLSCPTTRVTTYESPTRAAVCARAVLPIGDDLAQSDTALLCNYKQQNPSRATDLRLGPLGSPGAGFIFAAWPARFLPICSRFARGALPR